MKFWPPSGPRRRLPITVFSVSLIFAATWLYGADLKEAHVTQVVNDVKLLPEQAPPRPATVNDSIRNGTAVRTGTESRSELTFTDQTIARLGANTIFSFSEGTRNLDLGGGAMLLRVPKNAGGAKITTAAVTAAVTGTTLIMENHPPTKAQPRPYFKIIVLEGTVRAYQPKHVGDSVLIHSGEMLIGRPGSPLPNPVHVDLKRLVKTSRLINGFRPLASANLIDFEIGNQLLLKSQGQLVDTNLVIYGRGTLVSLIDTVDQSVTAQEIPPTPTPESSSTPTPSPSPTVTPTPTPSATPVPTPTKYGTPPVIAGDYVIDQNTIISTDPSITNGGVTDYGKIYRDPTLDGSRSTWLFGSTSAFDIISGFDSGFETSRYLNNIAVFKFQNLELDGDPIISTEGGVTALGLIGVDGITTGDTGGVLTFSGIDTLLLATQDGSISLGSNFSFQDIGRLYIYARGVGSNLTIDSSISTLSDLHLYSQGDVTIGGALDTINFSSFSGGDFDLTTGTIRANKIFITSQSNINIGTDQFSVDDLANLTVSFNATNAVNIDVQGDQSVFANASSILVTGQTINLTNSGEGIVTLNLNVNSPATFVAGSGGIQAPRVAFSTIGGLTLQSGGNISIFGADIPFVNGTRVISGTITAAGFFNAVSDVTTGSLSAGTSITVGGDLLGIDITAGSTIGVGGTLTAFGTVTAGGNITADEIAVPTIFSPTGALIVGAGGIHPLIADGAGLQHTFTIDSIVCPAGIDFSGNQFGGIDGLSSGGLLAINARTITFDSLAGIGFVNFNGADVGGFDGINPTTPGSGGTLTVNTTGPITVNSDIEATTGFEPLGAPAHGKGGKVLLTSAGDTVTVTSRIEVSSTPAPGSMQRRSAKGGKIAITSGKVAGVAIDIANTAQLLALLDRAAPGAGGKINILATGANSSVNVKGLVQADRGVIDIRQTGANGAISLGGPSVLDSLTAHGDVLKVGALGTNGTLTIGQGNLSADSLLKLYASGSNGEINFIANATLTSGTGTILAGNTITIQPHVIVTIAGDGGPAQVYTNNPNYSGFGGNNPDNGTFGGNGANDPLPLADAPPFGPSGFRKFGSTSQPGLHSQTKTLSSDSSLTFNRPYFRFGSSR